MGSGAPIDKNRKAPDTERQLPTTGRSALDALTREVPCSRFPGSKTSQQEEPTGCCSTGRSDLVKGELMLARRRRLAMVVAGLVLALLTSSAPLQAQEACTFRLGFKALHDRIPDVVGLCVENEHFNPGHGNSEQPTPTG